MNREDLSVRGEPALHGDAAAQHDPAERTAAGSLPPEEIDALRDSVFNEPHLDPQREAARFRAWLAAKRRECSLTGNLLATLAAGLVAGPFAVLGAFAAGNPSAFRAVYIVLFGPVVEEMLKQSGMLYLLERKPYRVFSSWQFPVAAVLSAFVFASIENLLYIHQFASVYTEAARLAQFSLFRWKVCTALHICCALIASLGLRRVWREQLATGRPADVSTAFPMFAAAMAVHGVYNLGALFLSDIF